MTVRRSIATVLALSVALILGLPAPSLAQEGGEEQAPETLVISQWKCDYAHIDDIQADDDSLTFPIWQGLVDEGMIESVGTYYHEWGDAWNYNVYYVAEDKEAFFDAYDEATRRFEERTPEDDGYAIGKYCTEHKDNIYTLGQSTDGSYQDDNPLEGAWLVVMVEPADDEVVEEPEPALFLFTETHYSIMAAVPGEGNESRPAFENREEPTDAEKVEAYDSFFANSGRYEVEGDSVTTRAFVAKNPNYMDAWPENANSFRFRVEGDTLYWHFGETVVTLERVEGTEAPY